MKGVCNLNRTVKVMPFQIISVILMQEEEEEEEVNSSSGQSQKGDGRE